MNFSKITGVTGIVSDRNTRFMDVKRAKKRKRPEFFIGELEKRQLLATFTVTDYSDASTSGTLRWAISQANSTPGDDIIDFSGSWPQTITLTAANGPIIIGANASGGNLTISGPGQSNLTISGGNATGIFHVQSNTTIDNLSIKYGNRANLPNGGAIYNNRTNLTINNSTLANNTAGYGGAVYNEGQSGNATLTISNSTLANNTATQRGGAVYNEGYATLTISTSTLANNTASAGGASYNDGYLGNATLTISSSTLANNTAGNKGGAVYNEGYVGKATLSISNSTLANNTATNYGGAFYNEGYAGNATLTISSSTLANNTAGNRGGAAYNDGYAGYASLTISSSTLANNTAGNRGGAVFNDGYAGYAAVRLQSATIAFNNAANGGGIFDSDSAGNLCFYNSIIANNTATNGDGNVNGTIDISQYSLYSTSPTITSNTGSLVNTDPLLGSLGDYGGPTRTIPILPGSPAINGGYNVIGTTDQRGMVYNANDVGAYAFVAESACTVVSTTQDVVNSFDGLISLREAITYAGTLGGASQTITFSSSLTSSGNATITLTPGSSPANNGPLTVNLGSTDLTIQGPTSGNSITVSGGNATGIFHVLSNTTINNLSIVYGNGANQPNGYGGAIYNNQTNLTINNSTLANNTASFGGAVYNYGQSANATLTVSTSTLANNTATQRGGAVYNYGQSANATVTVSTSTLANNTATFYGGAVYNEADSDNAAVTLQSATIAFNNAANGGGIFDSDSAGNLSFYNSIIANNTATNGDGNVNGTIDISQYSLYSTSPTITSNTGSLVNTDPLLGTLGDYGGPTKVFPLLPGSPAIDSGTGTDVTDQRGIIVAGAADMGSFQSRGFNITKTGGGNEVSMIGHAFPTNLTLNIKSSYGEPVVGGVISFTFANSTGGGNSANGTGFTAGSSQATIVQNANISDGKITLTAVANNNYDTSNYTALGNATGANAAASYLMKNVGLPDSVTIVGNNNQTLGFNSNFTPFTVTVKDNLNNVIPRANVVFSSNSTTYGATANLAANTSCNTYSALTDDSGNVTSVAFQSNNIGGIYGLTANAVQGTAISTYLLTNLELRLQNGYNGRSFVNNVAGVFGSTTLASDLVNANRVQVQYLGYSGTETPNNVTLASGTAGSGNITWNYGSGGITGNPNSATGDGVYRLAVDYNGDGNWSYVNFHRLFGDVNGDKVVDTVDYRLVLDRSVFGRFGVLTGEDTNGAGRVFSKDITNTLRQRGRRVANYNPYG